MIETLKFDKGKVEFSDVPQMTLKSVAQVFNYGAKKYAKFNYSGGTDYLRYYDATMRHMHSWVTYDDIDSESHLNHLDHAICSLMMLRENIHMGRGTDNRNKLYKKQEPMSDGQFQVLNEEKTYNSTLGEKNLGVVYTQPDSETQLITMLLKIYPNDNDLGAAVRKAYGQQTSKIEQLDKEMD